MSKKSKAARDQQRRAVVALWAARRAELKHLVIRGTPEARIEALRALAKQPRDASPTRLRNRDVVDGRPRGYLRAFGLSRIRFREMAHAGELPGVRKASW